MEKFDLADASDLVVELVRARVSVEDGMLRLIDFCRRHFQGDVWNRLETFDFASDIAALKRWLFELFENEPLPATIRALWFGIFNPVIDGETTCGLYVCGYQSFYSDIGPGDWDSRNRYWPDGRYADSSFLHELYRLAYRKGGPGNLAEYTLGLGYAALAVTRVLTEIDSRVLLGPASGCELAVACGFDEGDHVFLGLKNRSGFPLLQEDRYLKPTPAYDPETSIYEILEPHTGRWWLKEIIDAEGDHLVGGFANRGESEQVFPLLAKIKHPVSKADFNFTVLGTPVIRCSIARELQEMAPNDIQLLPVTVEGDAEEWAVLNVISFVPWEAIRSSATDKERSPWLSKFGERKIFRAGEYPGPIAVARDIKERLDKTGIAGIKFAPLGRENPWRYLGIKAYIEARRKNG